MKNKILLVVAVLFGLMMINSGVSKFTNHMPAMDMPEAAGSLMQAFMKSGWLLELIAIVEIIGGLLFAIPKYRALGAVVILPITVGIFLFNAVLSPSVLPVGAILLLINLFVIWNNKERYHHIIA